MAALCEDPTQFSLLKSFPARCGMQQLIRWAPHPWASETLLRRSRFLAGVLWDRGRVVHISCGLRIPAWTALDAEAQANEVSLSCEQSYLAALLCSGLTCRSELLSKGTHCSCIDQPVITKPGPGDRKRETNFLALCNFFPVMLCSTCTGSSLNESFKTIPV